MVQERVDDVDAEPASTQPCHLLALPTELRLLIYEACFGPTRCQLLYWEEDNCWLRRRTTRSNGDTMLHSKALLLTCRQLTNEVQPMFNERNVPRLIDPWYLPNDGEIRRTIYPDQLRFLQQVPAVIIDVTLWNNNSRDKSPGNIRCWKTLRSILSAMDQGTNIKSLEFVLDPYCDPEIMSEGGKLTSAIEKLHCPKDAVKIEWQKGAPQEIERARKARREQLKAKK
ncbi:hypothetical protein LTR27_000492 [Elasticomyces elasticus]|nr:hypothetical protein LTR27_000492 [Elasticomyces elasticus]